MIAMVLLTEDDSYEVEGRLPQRPIGDKNILRGFYKNTYRDRLKKTELPDSIANVMSITPTELPVRIRDIGKSDIIIVNRSKEYTEGKETKKFRLDGYHRTTMEVWVKDELI